MASYPTAVKAFTTKSDGSGNTIFAAHINDLQDEVTAIEDGILNGTAPFHSSNAIVNTLQVNAGSTFATTLQVTGNSTFAGTVAMTGNVTITGKFQSSNSTLTALNVTSSNSTLQELFVTIPPPSVHVYASASVQVPNNVLTVVTTFDTERFNNPTSMHSTTTTPSRLIAPSSGIYLAVGQVHWNANTSNTRQLNILLNGVTRIGRQTAVATAAATNPSQNVTALYNLSANDYVELEVFQDTGSTLSLSTSAGEGCEFSLVKVR